MGWPDLSPFATWWGTVGIIEGLVGLWIGYRLIQLRRSSGKWVVVGSSLLIGWGIPWAFGLFTPTPGDEWARRLTIMFLFLVAVWLTYGWLRVRDVNTVRKALESAADEGNHDVE